MSGVREVLLADSVGKAWKSTTNNAMWGIVPPVLGVVVGAIMIPGMGAVLGAVLGGVIAWVLTFLSFLVYHLLTTRVVVGMPYDENGYWLVPVINRTGQPLVVTAALQSGGARGPDGELLGAQWTHTHEADAIVEDGTPRAIRVAHIDRSDNAVARSIPYRDRDGDSEYSCSATAPVVIKAVARFVLASKGQTVSATYWLIESELTRK